jgi:hypothetical protein
MNVLNKRYDPAVPVDALKPLANNVNQADLGAISLSVAHNGFYGALLVEESTGEIVAGNHRFRAAIGEGATTIPVIYAEFDSPETKRKIAIADNQTNRLGTWDQQGLLEELTAIRSDFGSLLGTGFDDNALQELCEDLGNGLLTGLDLETPDPKPDTPEPVASSPEPTGKSDSTPKSDFAVIIACQNEIHQQEVLDDLKAQGYKARAA